MHVKQNKLIYFNEHVHDRIIRIFHLDAAVVISTVLLDCLVMLQLCDNSTSLVEQFSDSGFCSQAQLYYSLADTAYIV